MPTPQTDSVSSTTTMLAVWNGSTMSYTFSGTQISIYGTVLPTPSDGELSTTSYTVISGTDNVTSTTLATGPKSATTRYGYQFYASPPLMDGQHTIIVEAVNVEQDANVLWFDYLAYQPSKNVVLGDGGSSSRNAGTPGPSSSMLTSTASSLTASSGAAVTERSDLPYSLACSSRLRPAHSALPTIDLSAQQ